MVPPNEENGVVDGLFPDNEEGDFEESVAAAAGAAAAAGTTGGLGVFILSN